MRIWVEVLDTSGVRQGIVNLTSCTITRNLDSAGRIELAMPATDKAALDLMAIGRSVRVYRSHPKTYIGGGILLRSTMSVNAGGMALTWEATDQFEELRRENTLLGLVYNNRSIQAVVKNLVQRVSGWQVGFDNVSGNTSTRFQGASILQALTSVAQLHGYHLRLAGDRLLQFGAFGADNGVRLSNITRQMGNDRMLNGAVAIETLNIDYEGHEIVNWIVPVAGQGDAALTLRRATTSSPYTIGTMTGPDGRTVYYLSDASSISSYGTIQRIVQASQPIIIVEPSENGLINAANVLYDWAASHLERVKDPQTVYSVSGANIPRGLLPGDKIRLAYKGRTRRFGEVVRYIDINELFWVIVVTESYNLSGNMVQLQISSTDEAPQSVVDMVSGLIRKDAFGSALQLQVNRNTTRDMITLAAKTPTAVTFDVSDTTIDIASARVTVTRTDAQGEPSNFSLTLNATAIDGGPFLWGVGVGTSFTAEFMDVLLAQSPIQGEHTLYVQCQDGAGDVTVKIEIGEVSGGLSAIADDRVYTGTDALG